MKYEPEIGFMRRYGGLGEATNGLWFVAKLVADAPDG